MQQANRVFDIIVKTIGYLLLIAAVLGLLFGVAYLTNGFDGRLQSLYIVVNDTTIYDEAGGYALAPDEAMEVEVQFLFTDAFIDLFIPATNTSALPAETEEQEEALDVDQAGTEPTEEDTVEEEEPTEEIPYTVKVVPNLIANKDVAFAVDWDNHTLQTEKDLTAGFDIQMTEKKFVIKPKGHLPQILANVYPENIVNVEQVTYPDMFTLVISAKDGSQKVMLNFTVFQPPTIINMQEVIVF